MTPSVETAVALTARYGRPHAGGARSLGRTMVSIARKLLARTSIVAALGVGAASPALADEPAAQDGAAGAEAFDRGTSLVQEKKYDEAASQFETAHRLTPTASALVEAVRAHVMAGNTVRAATLALRLEALYPEDELAASTARETLDAHARQLVRVDVRCDDCTVEVDGASYEHPSFFVEPEQEHRLTATFTTGEVSKSVAAGPGETVEIAIDPPPAPTEPAPAAQTPAPAGAETPTPSAGARAPTPTSAGVATTVEDHREGLVAPAVPIVFAGFTAATAALTAWSAVQTRDAQDAYEKDPTEEGFNTARNLEKRTNGFIGTTAALGAATIATTVLALVKRKPKPDRVARVRPAVALHRGQGWAGVEGTLP